MEAVNNWVNSPSNFGYGHGYGIGEGREDGCGDCYDFYHCIGHGEGHGSGEGVNRSTGYGRGRGSGEGERKGNGYGRGYDLINSPGISNFCGNPVYIIDGLLTILYHIHGNIAKAGILSSDLTVTPCYVVKSESFFAHGATLREAQNALQRKIFKSMPEEERIEAFLQEFSNPTARYPVVKFFDWHHYLTGSCEAWRRDIAEHHDIDMEHGQMTLTEFFELTRYERGWQTIIEVEVAWKNRTQSAELTAAR